MAKDEIIEGTQSFYYPVKIILPEGKSRLVYFPTRQDRKKALMAVLAAQGFQNQLDQYELLDTIGQGSANPVFVATHLMTGLKVVIKAIDTAKYKRLRNENNISESIAMHKCHKSNFVASLVEEFSHEHRTYIVTKFYKGGDLVTYMDS